MSIDRTPATQPPLWVITYRGKPVTLGRIHSIERGQTPVSYQNKWFDEDWEEAQYIAGRARRDVIAHFLHYVGFTWAERAKGFDVQRLLSS